MLEPLSVCKRRFQTQTSFRKGRREASRSLLKHTGNELKGWRKRKRKERWGGSERNRARKQSDRVRLGMNKRKGGDGERGMSDSTGAVVLSSPSFTPSASSLAAISTDRLTLLFPSCFFFSLSCLFSPSLLARPRSPKSSIAAASAGTRVVTECRRG